MTVKTIIKIKKKKKNSNKNNTDAALTLATPTIHRLWLCIRYYRNIYVRQTLFGSARLESARFVPVVAAQMQFGRENEMPTT